MNHLNSSLLEGVLVTKPEYSEKTKQATFRIQSNRFYKKDGELIKHETFLDIIAEGFWAKETLSKREGSEVRIIGRLDRVEGNAVIVAEHLEFKGRK